MSEKKLTFEALRIETKINSAKPSEFKYLGEKLQLLYFVINLLHFVFS